MLEQKSRNRSSENLTHQDSNPNYKLAGQVMKKRFDGGGSNGGEKKYTKGTKSNEKRTAHKPFTELLSHF